jgi:hypothetical protein
MPVLLSNTQKSTILWRGASGFPLHLSLSIYTLFPTYIIRFHMHVSYSMGSEVILVNLHCIW